MSAASRAPWAEKWQQAITESGRSVASIAREVQVPRSTFAAQVKRGNMPITTWVKMAMALGVDWRELI